MRIFGFICVLVVVTSSCNRDDVISIAFDNDSYRAATPSSAEQWDRVWEYTPAPGQLIGDTSLGGFTGEETSPEAAVEYATGRMCSGKLVSLGGFGGYIVVGFDHSIDNVVGCDLAIRGNAYEGSSEPGIVWVMQDENGDGLPNDMWYELRGSETAVPTTISNYSVTYFRPSASGQPVLWCDSEGEQGQIDYLGAFHSQPHYYPTWIEADDYTLTGTRLESRNYDQSGGGSYWVQPSYDWGYADNFSDRDYLVDDKTLNVFDISNAIDANAQAVELKYIDFVKVQCAVNSKSGWLGEMSTEVSDFIDYGLKLKRNE